MNRRAPVVAIIIPSAADLVDVARMAIASHLFLATDGRRTVLGPIVPQGFQRIHVGQKCGPKGVA